MNDDALAAVAAAAQLLIARNGAESDAAESAGAESAAVRWNAAARMPTDDAGHARLVARSHSRWTMSGRLRD